jgi:hypothetical protein
MMKWFRFYGECVRHAPKKAWGWIGSISTLATFTPPIAAKVFHFANQDVMDIILFYSLPTAILVSLVIVPFREAYRLYVEKEKESASAKTEYDEERRRLQQQIDDLRARLLGKQDELVNKKAHVYSRLNKLRHDLNALVEARKASFPMSRGQELRAREQRHAQETKDMLAALLIEAKKEASEVSLDNFLPTLSDLDDIQPKREGADKVFLVFRDGIDAVLKRLS